MPHSYGVDPGSAGLLPWRRVAERLSASRNYWIVTGSQDRVHAAPVWGLWTKGKFYFSTDPESRKGRNLADNPNVVVHLESGDDVTIVEGLAERVPPESADMPRLAETYERKYRIRVDFSNPSYALYKVNPRSALAWEEKDFPQNATRWRF